MTTAIARACSTPGCPAIAGRQGKCSGCARGYERQRRASGSKALYDSPQWKALRARVMAAHPWCGCGARTTQVDHVRAVRDGGAALDEGNLEALCKPCHSRKTLRENRREGVGARKISGGSPP